jgi:hypothetical protein
MGALYQDRLADGTVGRNNFDFDFEWVGEGQKHIQKTDPFSRQRVRPTKQDRNCHKVINIWSWAPDGARHQDLLIDRQSQCDFDFDWFMFWAAAMSEYYWDVVWALEHKNQRR